MQLSPDTLLKEHIMKNIRTLAISTLTLLTIAGAAVAQQSAPAATRPVPHQHAMDHFKAADTDKDGSLSRAEADKAMPMLASRFDTLDADKDGKLTPTEMQTMAGMRGKHGQHGGMKRVGHHGGQQMPITRAELVARHEQMLKGFDAADANRDGTLSPEERSTWHEKMRAERKAPAVPAPAK
jgi:EF hand